MLLHDNSIPFFVNVQAVVIFHLKVKCTNCIFCVKCIFIMADSDKTLIRDGNLSNNNRNVSVPSIVPPSSGTVHPDTHPTHHVAVSEPSTLKRKQTSFQITSVTVKGSRLSTDGGEDSADDLDESHTEDVSSEILDCSRTTDVDNDQLSEDNSNTNNDDLSNQTPSIPVKCKTEINVKHEAQIDVAVKIPSESSKTDKPSIPPEKNQSEHVVNPPTLPDQWQHRFRVVKIVSSEPFKRGRWLCMDFMDPPAPAVEAKSEISELSSGSNIQLIPGSCFSDAVPSDRVAHIYEISPSDAYPGSISVAVGPDQIQQPMYGIFLPVNNGQYPFITGMHSVLGPAASQKETVKETSQSKATNTCGIQQTQNISAGQTTFTERQQQQQFACQPAQGLSAATSQPPSKPVQPATAVQACPQHQSQTTVKVSTSAPTQQQPAASAPTVSQSTATPATITQPQLPPQSQQAQDSQLTMQQPQIQPSITSQSHTVPVSTISQNISEIVSKPIVVSSNTQIGDLTPIPATTISSAQPQVSQISNVAVAQSSTIGTQASAVANIPEVVSVSSTKNQETVTVPSQVIQNHVEIKELGTPPSTNPQVSEEILPEPPSAKSDINGEESESVPSGTSTVAIDNKIEQAMDLVKSHLMFAVREEVDVLKEKITELMDRISQLEYENGFLRANASQQTLEQLNQSQLLQQQQQQNQPSTVSMNSFPQQSVPQQQINIQNQ
ncbi:Protein bunched, class 2/F isoform, partial [Stegodyphus mimosarum]